VPHLDSFSRDQSSIWHRVGCQTVPYRGSPTVDSKTDTTIRKWAVPCRQRTVI
jgi:hypothetical protein